MANYKKIKKQAWVFYKAWMKDKTYCPCLGQEVRISRKGWDHLISGSKSKKRTIRDKLLKLSLLKEAKYVIKNAKTHTITYRNQKPYTQLEAKITLGRRKGLVRVLLKKDDKGKYVFYSVMQA